MGVTPATTSGPGIQVLPQRQLMPQRDQAAPVSVDSTRPIPAPPSFATGIIDLSYTVESRGEGMTISLIDRASGNVVRQLEFYSPLLRHFQQQARAGALIDIAI